MSSVLVVAPHPDDESFGCGGTLAQLLRNRVSVHVVFVTDGSASHPGHPGVGPSEIAARRAKEAQNATAALGIQRASLSFLGVRDGTLSHLDEGQMNEVAETLTMLLQRLAPDAVLVPCRRDGSSEHEAAYAIVRRALESLAVSPRVLEFPIWSWWSPVLLLRHVFASPMIWRIDVAEVLDLKARALASYVSQTLPMPPDLSAALPEGFTSMFLGREEFLFEE